MQSQLHESVWKLHRAIPYSFHAVFVQFHAVFVQSEIAPNCTKTARNCTCSFHAIFVQFSCSFDVFLLHEIARKLHEKCLQPYGIYILPAQHKPKEFFDLIDPSRKELFRPSLSPTNRSSRVFLLFPSLKMSFHWRCIRYKFIKWHQ